jgi:hypothetical protein
LRVLTRSAVFSGVSRRARAAAVAVAVLLVTVAWVTPQVPSAAARATPRCGAYKGKRLLRSRSLTVIVRAQEQQREYAFICVPPRGPVHLAGWAFDETHVGSYSVKVLGSAGSWAAIQFESTVDFHGGEVVDKMCNARNGHCYYFFHRFTYGMPELEEGVEQSELEGIVVNSFGQMLLAETGKGATRVIGVGSDGSKSTLDSAPEGTIQLSSLKLVGHEASWIDGGVVKRARV